MSLTYIFIGLVGLVFGGQMFVDGAVKIAQILGMSERVIGLTVVAIGTSLPELVTSIVAARKGQNDIAVGNIVGSNIFNIFWIL
jgi:cation:H+ antiporter